MNSLSTPAMMRSSVDLPAPLPPMTPILAPGIEGEVDALEDLALGRDDLAQILHREDVLLGHGARVLAHRRASEAGRRRPRRRSRRRCRGSSVHRSSSVQLVGVTPPESHSVLPLTATAKAVRAGGSFVVGRRAHAIVVALASSVPLQTPSATASSVPRLTFQASAAPAGGRSPPCAMSCHVLVKRREAAQAVGVEGEQQRARGIEDARGGSAQGRGIEQRPGALVGDAEAEREGLDAGVDDAVVHLVVGGDLGAGGDGRRADGGELLERQVIGVERPGVVGRRRRRCRRCGCASCRRRRRSWRAGRAWA